MSSPSMTIFWGFIIALIVLVAMVGNLFVCFAIWYNPKLRRKENAFIISLALSDFLVACPVMIFSGSNELLGRWIFGTIMCDLWLAIDILCATASILNLCAVALVRYIRIKNPFRHQDIVTSKVIAVSLIGIWTVSFMIATFPIILGYHLYNMHSGSKVCRLELSTSFALITSSISFYLPCLIMVYIYSRLYFYSRLHLKNVSTLSPCTRIKNDYKAAVTIGVIMGIFLMCWLPFFIANIIRGYEKSWIPDEIFTLFMWFGYINSMLDPFVHSIMNRQFRKTFRKMLGSEESPHTSTNSTNNSSIKSRLSNHLSPLTV